MLWYVNLNDFNIEIIIKTFIILGVDKIEFLQTHEKIEIYERAFSILQEYFSNDEEETGIAPQAQNNEYQFNVENQVPMDGYNF